jgi:OCT family organic cation transporter-like MFS transporter 4/5
MCDSCGVPRPHRLALPCCPILSRQLADRLGRKACLFLAAGISAVFPAAGLACTSYWLWLAMRLLSGVGAAGTALASYILATEPIGESWRGAMGIGSQVFFIVGEFALVAAASAFPSWHGQAAATAVANAAVLLLWPLLPESGRWLQCQGRAKDAAKVISWIELRMWDWDWDWDCW